MSHLARMMERRLAVMERVIWERTRSIARVLDLGCGEGRFSVRLPQAVGIDVRAVALAVARSRGVQVALADAHALPFAASSFGAVVLTLVFEQLRDQVQVLRECHRVLQPGGVLAVQCATDLIWSPRRPLRLTEVRSGPDATRTGQHILARALGVGFVVDEIRLWRWLRFYPYLVPAPPWTGLRVWSQGVLLLRKPNR